MSATKQVYFVIDGDKDVLMFEDADKFQNYYKVNPEVQVYLGTQVDVELVPAQVVVKGGETPKSRTGKRGAFKRDAQNRPLKSDGTPFAPRGSKKNGAATTSATPN